MSNKVRIHVTRNRPEDNWKAKREGARRASGLFPSQQKAETGAKKIVRNSGGGEVVIHKPDGTIRDSDTIPSANDPNPPKDRVH